MSDETQQRRSIEEISQEPDVAEAVASAKAHLAAQWAVFNIEPEVYVVEACGLPCVLLPWSNQRRMQAVRAATGLEISEKGLKLAEAVVTDCLYWIRGQKAPAQPGLSPQRAAALTHATGLANLCGGKYMNLLLGIGGEMMNLLGDEEAQPTGKKL